MITGSMHHGIIQTSQTNKSLNIEDQAKLGSIHHFLELRLAILLLDAPMPGSMGFGPHGRHGRAPVVFSELSRFAAQNATTSGSNSMENGANLPTHNVATQGMPHRWDKSEPKINWKLDGDCH